MKNHTALKIRSKTFVTGLGVTVRSVNVVSADVVRVDSDMAYDDVVNAMRHAKLKQTSWYDGPTIRVTWFKVPDMKGATLSVALDSMNDHHVRIVMVNNNAAFVF